jgi:hypothetical protein
MTIPLSMPPCASKIMTIDDNTAKAHSPLPVKHNNF